MPLNWPFFEAPLRRTELRDDLAPNVGDFGDFISVGLCCAFICAAVGASNKTARRKHRNEAGPSLLTSPVPACPSTLSGGRSVEAERCSLCLPVDRDPSGAGEFVRCQRRGLMSLQDGLCDVRREPGQA